MKRQIKNVVFIFDFSEPQFVRIVSHENEKLKSKNSCALWIFVGVKVNCKRSAYLSEEQAVSASKN